MNGAEGKRLLKFGDGRFRLMGFQKVNSPHVTGVKAKVRHLGLERRMVLGQLGEPLEPLQPSVLEIVATGKIMPMVDPALNDTGRVV